MSFDNKEAKRTETDDLKIKSHLNTSLEAEGISVSEDLIKRTIEAINNQKDEELKTKKLFVFPFRQVRTLVAVAAAFLVLVVAFNAIRILGPGGMKSDNAADEAKSYDMDGSAAKNKESTSKNDNFIYDMDDSNDKNDESTSRDDILEYDMAEDSAEIAMESESNGFEEGLDQDKKEPDNNKMFTAQNFGLVFTEMLLVNPDNVKSISISSADNNETIVITEQEQIQLFYSIMDSYSYEQSVEQDPNIQLVIDLIGDDIDSQIIISQSTIIVGHTSKDTASHSIFSVVGQSELIEDLINLMNE